MNNVMNDVIKTVNFIKKHTINHRQFKTLLEKSESPFGDVIYFSEIRWLSRGQTLKRFFSLRKEITEFLTEKNRDVSSLQDINWLCDLTFLVDVIGVMNELNLKLQGNSKLIYDLLGYVNSTERKFPLLQEQLQIGYFCHFETCWILVKENTKASVILQSEKYYKIIQSLLEDFDKRFDDFKSRTDNYISFSDPFSCNPRDISEEMQFELTELQENINANNSYRNNSLIDFYKGLWQSESSDNTKTWSTNVFIIWEHIYLQKTFSIMSINKSKLQWLKIFYL